MKNPLEAERVRLDALLVEQGSFASRSRARDAVDRGAVFVDGKVATKAGQFVSRSAVLLINDPAQRYASRAALKLIAGLDHFGVEVEGKVALDIGASTGGFTEVLLERGAAHVVAIDVGHAQMDMRLREDRRVTVMEGVNARDLALDTLGGKRPELLVCDVSFISLKLALAPALGLALPGAKGVFLVKPQFEAGREAIGKGGLLRDPALAVCVAQDLHRWLDMVPGWRSIGVCPSPIEGGDGNREFLLAGEKA